ncbi:hypothetical protein AB4Z22_42470, partial [Paenibacillus sp. TAF58]
MSEEVEELVRVMSGSIARVGYCRAGIAMDRYVLVYPVGRMGRSDLWDVSFSSGYVEDGQYFDEPYATDASDDGLSFLRTLRIEWAPSALTWLIVGRLFPGVVRPPGEGADLETLELSERPYGRFTSVEGLRELLRIACTPDRLSNLSSERSRFVDDSGVVDLERLIDEVSGLQL